MTEICQAARKPVKRPHLRAPALACDSHFHIFGEERRYPFSLPRSYTPPPAPIEDYRAMADTLGLQRMVIVQPSVYGTDNRCTLEAMAEFGRDRCRAVVVVDPAIDTAELKRMDQAGVRGVRFNFVTAGGLPPDALPTLARKIAPLGWHLQLFIEGEQLAAMAPMLRELPVELVIDHMGQIMTADIAAGLQSPAVATLRGLLDDGRAWVKLCGYRSSSAGHPFADVTPLARHLIGTIGERCLWGTDWPHPGFAGIMPDAGELLDLLAEWAPDPAVRHRILVDNPAALYGFAPAVPAKAS